MNCRATAPGLRPLFCSLRPLERPCKDGGPPSFQTFCVELPVMLAFPRIFIVFHSVPTIFPSCFQFFAIFHWERKIRRKNAKDNMENGKIWKQYGKIQRQNAPLQKSQPFRRQPCPNPSPAQAQNSDASMTTHVKRVSCTTTMYVTTLRDCVTLCFPPVRVSCLLHIVPICHLFIKPST